MANSQLSIKRLMREREKMEQSNNDQFITVPNPNNIFEWHFVLKNIKDSPYQGGQYHGKILIPAEYPLKPPALLFVTPQGRFKCHEKICLSFTSFHPESWSTSWTIESMLIALISFMHTSDRTVGGLQTSDEQKRNFAKYSISFNTKNQLFQEIFKDHYVKLGITPELLMQNSHHQAIIPAQPVDSYQDLAQQPLDLQNEIEQVNRDKRRKIWTYIGITLLFVATLVLLIEITDD